MGSGLEGLVRRGQDYLPSSEKPIGTRRHCFPSNNQMTRTECFMYANKFQLWYPLLFLNKKQTQNPERKNCLENKQGFPLSSSRTPPPGGETGQGGKDGTSIFHSSPNSCAQHGSYSPYLMNRIKLPTHGMGFCQARSKQDTRVDTTLATHQRLHQQ